MTTNRDRLMRGIMAQLAEHFGTAVVIVPGKHKAISRFVGNRDMGEGLLNGAYRETFDVEEDERIPDPDDDDVDDGVSEGP